MTKLSHLNDDLLVRAMDDELPTSEALLVEAHLAACEECRQKCQELRALSLSIETAVAGYIPEGSSEARESLANKLEARESSVIGAPPPKVLQRFGWGMALAATLAIGVLFGPQWTHRSKGMHAASQQAQGNSDIEVDGETFVALPYSNPDLPMSSVPHIVQMQVPVSSLADAGIIFEPISSQVSMPDRSVLADVLLGIDGQPVGVHVLSAE